MDQARHPLQRKTVGLFLLDHPGRLTVDPAQHRGGADEVSWKFPSELYVATPKFLSFEFVHQK